MFFYKAKAQLCPDGLLFDDTIRNREKCVLPHNVDCKKREFQQEPKEGIDPRLHYFITLTEMTMAKPGVIPLGFVLPKGHCATSFFQTGFSRIQFSLPMSSQNFLNF